MRKIPRWLARAPIPLFRRGLGRLVGERMLMLEHRGRKSGLARYVVLEVVGRDSGQAYVVSGYGPGSQWFRNVLATPEVRVWWGRRRGVAGTARRLDPAATREVLERYRSRYPRAAKALGNGLGLVDLAAGRPLPDDVGQRLPVVAIDLVPSRAG